MDTGGRIVGGFELWFPKNEAQRVLWPTVVELSLDYFHGNMPCLLILKPSGR
jgi:hypothetical protein